jgi:hypothetical protein
MEVSGQLHAPTALLPGKEPRYPLDRRLDVPHARFEHSGEEKKVPAPAENRTSVVQPVA